ncbi:MAG: MerR family transcriptional regulator [Gemmatimonadetes bacterium]|nr:MerR family transcriptional regulator [Gemmatimonadota bacterium]
MLVESMVPIAATLSIGELALEAGVSVQTLRHYHRLGLLIPTEKTAKGYRRYSNADRVRLELIRALRGLDFDLVTIGLLLREAASTRAVVELHLRALDLQAEALARRRAVLRTLLGGTRAIPMDRLRRLQALTTIDGKERARFVQNALDARLRGVRHPTLHELIRRACAVEFPETPTDEQLAAWLELAEIVTDEGFLARHRTQPERVSRSNDMVALERICRPATDAVQQGMSPNSARAQVIVRQWVDAMLRRQGRSALGSARTRARALRDTFTTDGDPRESRFWTLLAELNPAVARSPVSLAWPWLMEGLAILAGHEG